MAAETPEENADLARAFHGVARAAGQALAMSSFVSPNGRPK
jgi:hypothetical protein